jgi:hypothetical protein
MKKQLLSLAIGLSLCFGSLSAQETTRVVHGKTFIEYGKSVKDIPLNADRERDFTIDAAIANDIFMSNAQNLVIKDFPVGISETKTVRLRPARPVADGQTNWLRNGSIPAKAPRIISYEGVLDGELKSSVFLTYFKGDLTGVVIRENGQRFVVAPEVKNYSSKHSHVLTSESNVMAQMGDQKFICGTGRDMADLSDLADEIKGSDKVLATGDLLEANVAVDITNTFYKKFNDYEKTQAYVVSLFGMVSRIYEDQANVTLHLGTVNIWDDINSDPYRGLGSGHQLLPAMGKFWKNNMVNAPRHFAHLLSGPPPPGSGNQVVVGVAYLGKLCSSPTDEYGGYGVSLIYQNNISLPAINYISDVGTIAHEIGHTFGSPHTHTDGPGAYNPPIDSCVTTITGHRAYAGDATWNGQPKPPSNGVGTIMSYCHLMYENTMQFVFGPLPLAKIRGGAEKCLPLPAKPKIFIQYPVGMQNLIAGAKEEIRWSSARVGNVNIQYSIDGKNWIDIQTGVPATDRKISWTVPQVGSSTVIVRVSDAANAGVFDQTEGTFSIFKATLSLIKPTASERIGQKEPFDITWNSQLVTSVKIEFSPNGEAPWQTIAENVASSNSGTSSFKWTAPEIITSEAVIRVSDATNGEIISQSAPFAIGKSVATLISPNGGEKWGKGAQVWISWNSDFVSRIVMEYSTDNGETWKRVRRPINIPVDAAVGAFLWTVPEDPANGTVLVRINNAATDEELDRSNAPFTLDLVSSVENDNTDANGLKIIGISPNPAGEEAYLQFTAGNTEVSAIMIEVVDVTGRVVAQFQQPVQFSSGEQTLKMNLQELPQGVYMLIVKDGISQISTSLRIVR